MEMKNREIRVLNPQFRVSNDEDVMRIAGYAAVFDTWSDDLGWFREKIAPGAFTDALKNSDTVALFNHDSNLVLGRSSSGTLRLKEDEKGLHMEVDLPDTQTAKDLYALVERGDVKQQSFAFIVEETEWRYTEGPEPDERTITKVKELLDVSPVTYPAYPDTTVAKRSFDDNKPSANVGENDETVKENEDIEIELILNKYDEE